MSMRLSTVRLAIKVMLVVTLIIISMITVLDVVFLERLAEPKIKKIESNGERMAYLVSEYTLSNFYNRKYEQIQNTLNGLASNKEANADHLLQVSVILVQGGKYYASTNQKLINRSVHPTLLNKLKANKLQGVAIDRINYRSSNQKTIPALQFIKNITFQKQSETVHLASVQLLYNYKAVISDTRRELLIIGGIILVTSNLLTWLLLIPLSRSHHKLLTGMNQLIRGNLDYRLQSSSKDEIGLLFSTFNNLVDSVKGLLAEKKLEKTAFDHSGGPTDTSLRKTDITCLCARIPNLQSMIDMEKSEDISDFIQKIIEPTEKIVQAHGGQIIKIVGDKYFVMFEGINSIDNAVRSALKSAQLWKKQNHERKVLGQDLLNFGIGLHSEVGIAGTLGTQMKSYTFVGSSASVASYLCACADYEEILISATMMESASGSYQHEIANNIKPFDTDADAVFALYPSAESDMTIRENITASESVGVNVSEAPADDLNDVNGRLDVPGRAYDSSIPDILEETLSSSPLELVDSPNINQEISENKELADIGNLDKEEQVLKSGLASKELGDQQSSEKSLWESFDNDLKQDD